MQELNSWSLNGCLITNKRYTKGVLALGSKKKKPNDNCFVSSRNGYMCGEGYEWNLAEIMGLQRERKGRGYSSSSAVL